MQITPLMRSPGRLRLKVYALEIDGEGGWWRRVVQIGTFGSFLRVG